MTIPTRLRHSPLTEVVWQLQFEPAPGASVADTLPGMLFGEMRSEWPELQVAPVPDSHLVPAELEDSVQAFRHAARVRLASGAEPIFVQVGSRVLTFNSVSPYIGWERFRTEVARLVGRAEQSGLIVSLGRHSLRYINLVDLEGRSPAEVFRLRVGLGDHALEAVPLALQFEVPTTGDTLTTVRFMSPAELTAPDGVRLGAVVDFETRSANARRGWADLLLELDGMHASAKTFFFEQVLSPEALASLGPEG